MGKENLGEDGKVLSGTKYKKCTYPPKTYTKGLDVKVKAEVDSMNSVPIENIDLALSQTVTRLASYTSEGLDIGLFLFYTCEMANNRGFSAEQTQQIITSALNVWNSNSEIKKKSNL
jgi:hypothetical protein